MLPPGLRPEDGGNVFLRNVGIKQKITRRNNSEDHYLKQELFRSALTFGNAFAGAT